MNRALAWFTPGRRKYIYRVSTAGLVVAGFYGVFGPDEVSVLSTFLGVALVTGMADANTETGRHAAPDR